MSVKHKDQPPRSGPDGEVLGLLLMVAAFLLSLILFTPLFSPDSGGEFWKPFQRQLVAWLGWPGLLLPLVLAAYGVAIFLNASLRQVTRWVLGACLALLAVTGLQVLIFGGSQADPGPAGRIAFEIAQKLRQALGLAAPLLLLALLGLGLKYLLNLDVWELLRSFVRWLLGLLTGAGHSLQGVIEAKMPFPGKKGGPVTAHDRTDVRNHLSELRQKIDILRQVAPKHAGLREPHEKVRHLQREIKNYNDTQLKNLQGELDNYSLMIRNVLLDAAHDLQEEVKAEALPEGAQAVKYLKDVAEDRNHELSVFLPSTQASAALEHLRRHLVNQLLSLGTTARKLESERQAAERNLQHPTEAQLQRELSAHHKRLRQWQEVKERFIGWHEYEQAYLGWPDLAADFDSGPTEVATKVATEIQKRPLTTLKDKQRWREELEQAIEEEQYRRLHQPDEDEEFYSVAYDEIPAVTDSDSGGLLSRLGHKLGQLIAPPGPNDLSPAPALPRSAAEAPLPALQQAPAKDVPAEPVPTAFAIEFGEAVRPTPPARPKRSQRPPPLAQRQANQPAPVYSVEADQTVPSGAAGRSAQPPARPVSVPVRPAAPDDSGPDFWDDEDMPFGPPAPRPVPDLRPTEVVPTPAPTEYSAPTSVPPSPRTAPAPWEEQPKAPAERPKGVSRRGAISVALPSEKLLDPLPNTAKNTVQMDVAAKQRGDMINETLRHFGLQARVVDQARGPTVTRYEIEPAPGEKISRIASLSNDLARALAVGGVRVEAPVPGKSVIGLEVPNAEREPVTFHQAAADNAFKNTRAKLPVILGKSIDGTMMVGDLAKMPHLLVAGSTGSGKSVCVNTLITSLLYKYLPTELRFVMVDPKMVELTPYDGIPHLVRPVVTNPADAAGVLLGAVAHMERRYKMMSGVGAKNLEQFNAKMRVTGEVELPHLVIIIDELADLMITSPKEVESAIMRLAQMARATGMHLILATQRPSVDILTSLIKVNIPARIAFAVSSSHDSRTILDTTGAERLTGMGDMLFYQPGLVKPLRLQGPYISEAESVRITDELRRMTFDDAFVEAYGADFEGLISSSGPSADRSQMDFSDPLLRQAALICIEEGQGSVSRLQRRLSVGHARAGKLMDLLEAMSIVGPHQGSKPREVLITEADLPEYFGK